MGDPLDSKGMFVAPKGRRPAGFEPGVEMRTEAPVGGELQHPVGVLGMGPDRAPRPGLLKAVAAEAVHPHVVPAERLEDLGDAVYEPGNRVQTLAEPGGEPAERGVLYTGYLRRRYDLHDEIPDGQQGGVPHRLRVVSPVIPIRREDLVVPRIGGVEVADDVDDVVHHPDLEHACLPTGRVRISASSLRPRRSAAIVREIRTPHALNASPAR